MTMRRFKKLLDGAVSDGNSKNLNGKGGNIY